MNPNETQDMQPQWQMALGAWWVVLPLTKTMNPRQRQRHTEAGTLFSTIHLEHGYCCGGWGLSGALSVQQPHDLVVTLRGSEASDMCVGSCVGSDWGCVGSVQCGVSTDGKQAGGRFTRHNEHRLIPLSVVSVGQ